MTAALTRASAPFARHDVVQRLHGLGAARVSRQGGAAPPGCDAGVVQGAGEDSVRCTVGFQGNILTSETVLAQASAPSSRPCGSSLPTPSRRRSSSSGRPPGVGRSTAAFPRHNSTSIGLGDRLMAVSVGAACLLAPLACCRAPLVLARTASHGSSHVLCCQRLCRRACTHAGAARGRGRRPG